MNKWQKRQLAALSLVAACCCTAAGGCADDPLPRDQQGWTERVRQSGVLPAGIALGSGAEHEALQAREKQIIEAVARRLNARVEWRPGNAHTLLEDLEKRDLPLLAATLPADSPFAQKVGLSRPYRENGPRHKAYCLAVAPGENRLLLLVDQVTAADEQQQRKPGENER